MSAKRRWLTEYRRDFDDDVIGSVRSCRLVLCCASVCVHTCTCICVLYAHERYLQSLIQISDFYGLFAFFLLLYVKRERLFCRTLLLSSVAFLCFNSILQPCCFIEVLERQSNNLLSKCNSPTAALKVTYSTFNLHFYAVGQKNWTVFRSC